jgi:hypothetical protein
MNRIVTSLIAGFALVASAQAATIAFDLVGVAGAGLLAGNEPGPPIGGSGGEIAGATGFGVFYDDVTNLLTVNVGWGSGNGFIDLSSNVNNQHIHGPTTNNFGNDGTGNFKQTAGIPAGFGLTRTSDSPSSGTIVNNTITFSEAQEADLFNGKFYINVHTVNNPGGEIRGFLVVPEPSACALAAFGALALMRGRRNRA